MRARRSATANLQGTLVLTKPFELEALAERVRELLEP
jgi:DNA-binding response OmpR family regulator